MKVDQVLIKEHIQNAFIKGKIEVKDHRKNVLVLENGIFKFNGVEKPKSSDAIEAIFLEALRLTRNVKLNQQEYFRKSNKWILKSHQNEL
ncbi:hypothetical protein [Aquimarina sp. RZ0]|uniref:hypothetical protein n=1 Tax=Aquimarina sp. RZ0 TaxID=2607730 RepID=UPI0011F2C740|nr:hypothetical protein [Aquimarina sp. RZ0]KAA1242864.1 hypothetical protein F0000_23755 [Aquimarina sp. RZ0]